MKLLVIIVSFLMIFCPGCENSTSVNPTLSQSEIQEILNRVKIEQTDYYTIHFQNSDSLFIDPSEVEGIIFGFFKNSSFIGVDTLTAVHTTSNPPLLTFSDTVTVSDSSSEITMGIKYILKNYDSFIVKKDFFLFSYPYQSTKIIFYYGALLPDNWIQDFTYRYPILYYHPQGPEGLLKIDMQTYETTTLVRYFGGDFMDGNTNYIYIDYEHYSIRRFNLNTDSVDAINNLFDGHYNSIQGIAVGDSLVYLIADDGKLYTFDMDLNLLNIKNFTNYFCLSLAYYKGYIYSVKYGIDNRSKIFKAIAATGQIIDEKESPALYTSSIKISKEGVLYFMQDFQKKFLYTWLDEIFSD